MRIHEFDSVEAVPPRFDGAFDAAEAGSMFLGRAWLEVFERHVARTTGQVCVLALEPEEGETLPPAVLPCWTEPTARRIRFLGNYYASLAGTVVDEAHPGAADAARLLAAAAAKRHPASSHLDLSPLAIEGAQIDALRAGLHEAGWWTQSYFCFGNWHLCCAGTRYDDYLARLSSRTRNTLKRRGKQFAKLPGARLELVSDEHGLDGAIAAYDRVYARSWKQPEPYPGFVPGLVRLAAHRGWLRMGIAWLGETPVAAQIWLVVRGRANIYKLAYDEEHKKLSAGSLLTDLLMRHVMDVDRVDEVDYLTGDDAYKQEWMSTRRERWGIAAFNPGTLSGLTAGVRHLGAARLKRLRPR